MSTKCRHWNSPSCLDFKKNPVFQFVPFYPQLSTVVQKITLKSLLRGGATPTERMTISNTRWLCDWWPSGADWMEDKICQGGPWLQSSGPCVLTPQCWIFNGLSKLLSPPLVSCLFLFLQSIFLFFRNLHLLTGAAINYNWINYTLMIKKCWIQMMSDKNGQQVVFFFSCICSRAWRHRAETGSQVCKIFLTWRERLDNLISHTDWEKRGITGEQRRHVGKSITCTTRPPGYRCTVLHTALCPKTFYCYWPHSLLKI